MTDTDNAVKPSLRERRRVAIKKTLTLIVARREELLRKLVRNEIRLEKLTRSYLRYLHESKPKLAQVKATEAYASFVEPTKTERLRVAPAPEDLDVPGFLKRDAKSEAERIAEAKARDAAAAAKLREEMRSERTRKSNGRIAKLKAERAGETKKMPLSGKDALKAIMAE